MTQAARNIRSTEAGVEAGFETGVEARTEVEARAEVEAATEATTEVAPANANASATGTASASATATPAPTATPITRPLRTVGPAVRPGATLAVTSAATAVALMNYTAPMLTLPGMTASFHTALSARAWLLNGAPLGLAALLLIAGSLADDHGRRRVFLAGTLALGITMGLGALAPTTLTFTLARVAQGMASAAILASSLGLLVAAFPAGSARIHATGVWGAFVSGGIALGPLLAGSLATLNWRLIYGALAVPALITAGFALRTLTESRAPRGGRPDVSAAFTLSLAFTALIGALTLGRDGWLRPGVLVLLAAAAVLTAVFVLVERRATSPMIDLALFRRAEFLASSAGALFTGLAVIGFFSYLPALLSRSLGTSPMNAAWLFVLWSGSAFVVALQARRLASRVAARHQLAIGFVLHAAGVLAMLGALTSGPLPRLIPGLLLAGIGSGLLNAALPRLAVESVPAERAAMGSGANNTARYIGSSAGVALTIAVAPAGPNTVLVLSAALAALAAALTVMLRSRARPGLSG
ncbi:MFS transporter [Streptomyces sp. NPDC057910]|uniref:MFS transporter n=1 Tax=Streptomyces sp. NPDC057910 TaxID=3346278 RepID=UPI0036EC8696